MSCKYQVEIIEMIKKFILLWTSLLTFAGFSKKKDENVMNDAILFSNHKKKIIVEDFEMDAYHTHS